jgi:hypothetical protein
MFRKCLLVLLTRYVSLSLPFQILICMHVNLESLSVHPVTWPYRSSIFSTLPFAKFNENEHHGIGHFVVANPTIKIFELLDLLI